MNNTRLIAAIINILIISGCAGSGLVTENSNKVNYYHDKSSEPWIIEGQFLQTASSIKILVNNKLSIDSKLSAVTMEGDAVGYYEGIPMKVTCQFAMSNGRQVCDVYAEDKFAASLVFDGCGFITCY